ncbi:unnamed protein product [Owenia fusiformis]|uniref:Uncharacterized protein n=3 Tax=Owenia fusiformis TaxID=6347 RepID=A0A8J1Y8S6_OWEFU|nr:unnamed protein product [Owenia fusiformis]
MSNQEKEMSIFLDVFRRADKNDDSALSWDEFKSFFADGVMTTSELENLFNDIDTHNTNNIDTGELCTYFTQHLGQFGPIFSAIEKMNGHVSQALMETSKEYDSSDKTQQFITRFLLREVMNQFAALQRPIDTASDALDQKAAETQEAGAAAAEVTEVKGSSTIPGRMGRRYRRQQSNTSQSSQEQGLGVAGGALSSQVDRLRSLIDRLETRVSFDIPEEQIDIQNEKLIFIVHRKLTVSEGCEKSFRNSLKSYIEAVNVNEDCQHLSVRSFKGSSRYVIYEIWSNDKLWKEHLSSPEAKNFQHANVDNLETPEQLNTLPVPESWLKKD